MGKETNPMGSCDLEMPLLVREQRLLYPKENSRGHNSPMGLSRAHAALLHQGLWWTGLSVCLLGNLQGFTKLVCHTLYAIKQRFPNLCVAMPQLEKFCCGTLKAWGGGNDVTTTIALLLERKRFFEKPTLE